MLRRYEVVRIPHMPRTLYGHDLLLGDAATVKARAWTMRAARRKMTRLENRWDSRSEVLPVVSFQIRQRRP